MVGLKNISLVALMMLIFICCKEIYVPEIDSKIKALVVEGLITDSKGPFTVKLTEALPYPFDSVTVRKYVTGALLTVTDNENNSFKLTEKVIGNYTMPSTFKAIIGNSYKLRIQTKGGVIYESDFQTLLPPQDIDSIHGFISTDEYLDNDNNLKTVDGSDIRIDLFKSVSTQEPMPYCRFNTNIVVQYNYSYFETDPDIFAWFWFYFGWRTYPLDENENITEDNSMSGNAAIKNHSLCFVPLLTSSYGFNTPKTSKINYYLRYNQYTLNKDSYDYYREANNQLAAGGKIFDPITSQLNGNMRCVSNPSNIVLGLFEVSSVVQSAYYFSVKPDSINVSLKKVQYTEVPKIGESYYKVWNDDPSKTPDDPGYIVIPFPDWWFH